VTTITPSPAIIVERGASLQVEILARSGDESLFAWTTNLWKPSGLRTYVPRASATGVPKAASQSLIVPSRLADATSLLSGENATTHTELEWR